LTASNLASAGAGRVAVISLGPPFPVQHSYTVRSSPRNVDLSALDIFVVENRMLINLGEETGNIWLANP
jgi:hypothetical protein